MGYKLLLVDDNAEVRKLLRLTLSFSAYDIREAANGNDALEMIREWQPCLVLLDIMMPGNKDGLQVCREIKQDPAISNTMVIMLSACGQEQDVEEGNKAGADGYLIKPFSPQEISTLINRNFHQLSNDNA